MGELVGRRHEREVLDEALRSPAAELVAVYGRRRVGKTFLVREAYRGALCFELVGIHGPSLPLQLRSFAASLAAMLGPRASVPVPADWYEAFQLLRTHLEAGRKKGRAKRVLFFDEVPWLASRRSGFLPAFEHFWNDWASRQADLVVVLCGSSASWMLAKIVRERGGLHNRVTRRLRIEPFSLTETEAMLRSRHIDLGRYQTIELYMAIGGVPHYLDQVRPGESAAQAIDRLCFARDGLLRTEFEHLYAALFEQPHRHEAVVRTLAKSRRGLSRKALLAATKLGSGGAATKVLDELEESGFIMQMRQVGHASRDAVYWLADEYSLFYLAWIERHRGPASEVWLRKQGTPAWRAWSGFAFEAVCLKHAQGIKRALGIAGVETTDATWSQRPGAELSDGVQIDLVIDRADRSINLCEMKFSETEYVVDKAYARELERKREAFRAATSTRKSLFLTLVTTYGIRANEHAQRLGLRSVTMDALFEA